MHWTMWTIEVIPWYVFMIVWLVAALWVKKTKTAESADSRMVYAVLIVGGCYLLFARTFPIAQLDERFIALSRPVQVTGVVLTWAGVALAIWARAMIGENWSGTVTRKLDHELIKRGPYAYVRHPIYSGLTLSLIGTALFLGEWRGLLGVAVALTGVAWKARKEEAFMLAEFGPGYEEYRRETGFLIPGW